MHTHAHINDNDLIYSIVSEAPLTFQQEKSNFLLPPYALQDIATKVHYFDSIVYKNKKQYDIQSSWRREETIPTQ